MGRGGGRGWGVGKFAFPVCFNLFYLDLENVLKLFPPFLLCQLRLKF